MRYLTGVTGCDVDPHRFHPRLGLLAQPESYGAYTITRWPVWAADNGCYSLKGRPFNLERWRTWLDGLPRAGCLFASAPDVLHWQGAICHGDAAATLEWAGTYLPLIRSLGFPASLVLQDGMTPELVPWAEVDGLFIGGSDGFKLGPVCHAIILDAVVRGVPCHMGRVNSHRRISLAAAMGCSTADGTYLLRGPKINVPKMLKWFDKLDQGLQGMFEPVVPLAPSSTVR